MNSTLQMTTAARMRWLWIPSQLIYLEASENERVQKFVPTKGSKRASR